MDFLDALKKTDRLIAWIPDCNSKKIVRLKIVGISQQIEKNNYDLIYIDISPLFKTIQYFNIYT